MKNSKPSTSEQDIAIELTGLPELLAISTPTGDSVEVAEQDHTEKNGDEPSEKAETIDSPAKVMRIGTMLKRLLKQARSADLDEASRKRLQEIYEVSVGEIGSALSVDLHEELSRLISPFDQFETPTTAELQIAKAQLVGWLEGLIRGMQAMLFAQQLTSRRQLEAMKTELPGGSSFQDTSGTHHNNTNRPSAYL
ncbi:MAG: DUF2587 domain-containing protein [Acidimicrobiaceae bacterium]|nr:DUF2587 domain-containing protein [Acidimicrobiaceae bacterium]